MSKFTIKAMAWGLAIVINLGFLFIFFNVIGLDGGYSAQLAKGELYALEGNLEKSVKAYTKAINIAPDSPDGYFNVADILIQSELPDKAIETLEQYIERAPRVPDAYERLLALYQEYNYPAAEQVALLQKAANLFGDQSYADRGGEIKKQLALVAAPIPDVEPGTYDINQTIKIVNLQGTDTAYYTTDGNDPDKTSKKYDADKGISVKKGKTMLRMITYNEAGNSSEVVAFLYTVGAVPNDTNLTNATSSNGNNVVNGGYAASGNSDIYYSNLNASRNLYSESMGQITTDQAYYVNVYQDFIYYVNGSDGNKVYRIKNDGTERQMIISSNVGMLHVAGTKLVYENKGEGSKLYYANLDGSSKKKISDDRTSVLSVNAGYVFYKNDTDGEKLYKASLDGMERIKLTEDRVYILNIYENNVYYMNMAEGGKVYRIPCDGGEPIQVTTFNVAEFCMDSGNIYYRGVEEKGIFRYNLTDGAVTKLVEDDGAKLSVTADYIYYVNYADGSSLYRVSTSGGSKQKVAK